MFESLTRTSPSRQAPPDPKIDPRLVSLHRRQSFEADRYRTLRLAVERADLPGCKVIGVTSPVAGDGKTVVAINLAGALAQARQARVLLIDADLRRPAVARYLNQTAAAGSGLVRVIQRAELTLRHCTRRLEAFNLAVIMTNQRSHDTYELLASPRLAELFEEARRHYDYVVVDTPPLVPVPDVPLLATAIDRFVVVVGAGSTPRKLLGAALDQLTARQVLGLVFNRERLDQSRYGDYYYSYYHRDR